MIRCIEVSFWVLAFHLSSVTVLMQQNPQAFLDVLVTKTLECVFQGLHSVPSPSSFVWLSFAPSTRGIHVDQRHSDLLRGYRQRSGQAGSSTICLEEQGNEQSMNILWPFSDHCYFGRTQQIGECKYPKGTGLQWYFCFSSSENSAWHKCSKVKEWMDGWTLGHGEWEEENKWGHCPVLGGGEGEPECRWRVHLWGGWPLSRPREQHVDIGVAASLQVQAWECLDACWEGVFLDFPEDTPDPRHCGWDLAQAFLNELCRWFGGLPL